MYLAQKTTKNRSILTSPSLFSNNQNQHINLIGAADFGLLHIRNKWEAHKITFSNQDIFL